jgi:hypothetical protein
MQSFSRTKAFLLKSAILGYGIGVFSFYLSQEQIQSNEYIIAALNQPNGHEILIKNEAQESVVQEKEIETIVDGHDHPVEQNIISEARFIKYKVINPPILEKKLEIVKIERSLFDQEIKKSTERMIKDTVSVFSAVPVKIKSEKTPVVIPEVVKREPAIISQSVSTIASASTSANPKGNSERIPVAANELDGLYQKMQTANTQTAEGNSKTIIRANTVNMNGKSFQTIQNFDVKFVDDSNEFHVDHGSGEISVAAQIASNYEIRRMSVSAQSHMSTTHDLVMEIDEIQMNIPLMGTESVKYLVEEHGLREDQGLVLVEMSDEAESVELIGTYSKKLYLNDNMKAIQPSEDQYAYVLFVNVKPGNNILKYLRLDRTVTSKIIHVASKELYYEANFFKTIDKIEFELVEMNLLAEKLSKLNINREDIQLLSNNTHPQKIDFAKYKFGKSHRVYGSRDYLAFKHLDDVIYIGIAPSQKYVVVPSEEIIRRVLTQFSVQDFKGQCIVQVDIPKNKKVANINFAGTANDMGMNLELKALDTDGVFYSEVGPETSRIFIKGENQGVISVMLTFTDGQKRYLNSYCADQIYLVEQL